MKPKEIIIKAFKREFQSERGLKIIDPNLDLVKSHLDKADHNLVVMTDLNKLGHSDWVVIAAYYSMYHSSMAALSRIGLNSKDHTTTVAVLEYFFGRKIDRSLLDKFNELKDKIEMIEIIKIEEKYIHYLWKIKKTRERMQYGIDTSYKETDIIMNNAREFVIKIKLLVEDIDDKFIGVCNKELNELRDYAEIFH